MLEMSSMRYARKSGNNPNSMNSVRLVVSCKGEFSNDPSFASIDNEDFISCVNDGVFVASVLRKERHLIAVDLYPNFFRTTGKECND
jgi:hypothetical protein